jgi:type IV pilus assembly protein PilW
VRAARGFSLVEFMVAIALGLLVTDAMMAMFVSIRSASRTTLGVAALSDGGRFALDTIEQAVRGAGNTACDSTAPVSEAGVSLTRVISGVVSGDPLAADYTEPLAGYEAANTAPGSMLTIPATPVAAGGAGGWATSAALGSSLDPLLFAPPTPAGQVSPVGSIIAGSDVLVVHETQQGKAPAYTLAEADAGDASFQVSSGTTFAGAGQVGAISNCVQAEVFQVANFSPAGVVTLGSPLLTNMNFGTGAQVTPIDTTAFYIGIGADGDGALYRYDSGGGVLGDATYSVNQELVPDVENMQILYGIETAGSSGTETADQYVTADQVATKSFTQDFNGVISVKIALLVASPPGAVPKGAAVVASPPELVGDSWMLAQADNRMRKVYEQTMFLRNMSP